MTSFITGSTGFLGSNLCKTLTDEGEDVVVLVRDIIPSRWLDEALGKAVKVRGDLRNFRLMKRIISEYGISHVFHFGAQAKVKSAYKNPINVYETNVMGTVNVLEACRQVGVEKVLVMATDKIFGETLNAVSSSPLQASEPYATSKAAVDLICDSYHETYGLNVIRVRSCNIYGLDLYSNRIVPNTVKKCLHGEKPIIFKGETETVRQYIYIQDILDAILTLMDKYSFGAYNVCTEPLLNQADVVLEISKHFPKIKPKYVKREAPPEISRQSMILTDFGWSPCFNFEHGIKLTIERFKEYGV